MRCLFPVILIPVWNLVLSSSATFSPCSVRHLHVLHLPVCLFPPRREECVENVPSELRRGAADLPSGRRVCGGFHWTEKGLGDLLLFHLFPVPWYVHRSLCVVVVRFYS